MTTDITAQKIGIGPFPLENADEGRLVPLSKALAFMPERTLAPGEDRLVRTGRPVQADELGSGEDHVRLTIDGELVAVAERHGGLLRPVTVIAD